MTDTKQAQLVVTRKGRILLHIACLYRDHKLVNHFKGIYREIIQQGRSTI
jgi:hypothetical protein